MFVLNDDLSIYATRGDIVFFTVSAAENGVTHKFQAGDLIRIKIFGKKAADNVVLQKDFPVNEETDSVEIYLSKEDTKIGEVISKPKDYWYEIELNPLNNPQTIIGYDDDGAKIFKLFPEGADLDAYEPTPEDIPFVDYDLDLSSTRPVQNQAIARAVVSLRADFEETKKDITKKSSDTTAVATAAKNEVAVERARIDNLVSGATAEGSEVVDIRVGADGVTHSSAGTAVRQQLSLKADKKNIQALVGKDALTEGSLQSASLITSPDTSAFAYLNKIPLAEGERLKVEPPEIEGVYYSYRFGYYFEDGSFKAQVVSTDDNVFTQSANCHFVSVGIYAKNTEDGTSHKNILAEYAESAAVVLTFLDRYHGDWIDNIQLKKALNEMESELLYKITPTDIVGMNQDFKETIAQAKRPLNEGSYGYQLATQPFVLLHFSDIHGDETELERIIEFKKQYDRYLDDTICTGDFLELRYSSDFTYWGNTNGAEHILLAIGNHDVITDETGWDYSQIATQQEQFNRFFAPFIEKWGVTYESGKTYYYKDYAAKKIRLITINNMLTGNDNAMQLAWFESVLTEALADGLNVVVANHYPLPNFQKVNCNFTSLDKDGGSGYATGAYQAKIAKFKESGGKFVCFIGGHMHGDLIGYNSTYPDQLIICIDALSRAQGNQYSDMQRVDNQRSQDLANALVVDTTSKVVKIVRIGANVDRYLRNKNSIVIHYETKEVVSQN